MSLEWNYSEAHDAWLSGTSNNGCGVYFDGEAWHANVVICGSIELIGPFRTIEEAQKEAENHFDKHKDL